MQPIMYNLLKYFSLLCFFFTTSIATTEPGQCSEGVQPPATQNCNCYCSGSNNCNDSSMDMKNKALLEKIKAENSKLKEEISKLLSQNSCFQANHSRNNFDLQFTNRGTLDHVIFHNLKDDLSEFTASLWMQTNDKVNQAEGVLLSYATSDTLHNAIGLWGTQKLRLYILDQRIETTVKVNDGKWHHVLVTWENRSGKWSVYKDGILGSSGSGVKTGQSISHVGMLILGQEQDSLGGKFELNQCFIGQISQVNIWNKVMSKQDISVMSQTCIGQGLQGNIFNWDEISMRVGIRGDVKVHKPSSCVN